MRRRQWERLRDTIPDLGARAFAARDWRLLDELSTAAERLGLHELATKFLVETAILRNTLGKDEWRGEAIDDATLVINFRESEKQGAAAGVRYTGHVARAAAQAGRTVLVVERRLVPLYRRTFPEVEVLAGPAIVKPQGKERVVTANMRVLRSAIGCDEKTIQRLNMPLIADRERSRRFRTSYQNDENIPLIGISWWSSHHGKDLPPLEAWAGLMRSVPARYVNLQYGDVSADLDQLRELSGRVIIHDKSVDQMKDMDLFAAQLASLDAMVTISCTGAHLASALHVPIVLVRDDWFRRDWPVLSATTPWCPSVTVVGKDGADWSERFASVETELRRQLSAQRIDEGMQ